MSAEPDFNSPVELLSSFLNVISQAVRVFKERLRAMREELEPQGRFETLRHVAAMEEATAAVGSALDTMREKMRERVRTVIKRVKTV